MQCNDLIYDILSGDSLCRTDFVYPGLLKLQKKWSQYIQERKVQLFLVEYFVQSQTDLFQRKAIMISSLSLVSVYFNILTQTVKAAGWSGSAHRNTHCVYLRTSFSLYLSWLSNLCFSCTMIFDCLLFHYIIFLLLERLDLMAPSQTW